MNLFLSRFSLSVEAERVVEQDKKNVSFNIFIGLESKTKNDTCMLSCKFDFIASNKIYLINCYFIDGKYMESNIYNISYDNAYLYPYILPKDDSYPYELIIPNVMEGIRDVQIPIDDPEKFLRAEYLNFYNYFIIFILLL